MKRSRSMVLAIVTALIFALPAHPEAAVGDDEMALYYFPGVRSDGTERAGVATSFACTNFGAVTEAITIEVRDSNGVVVSRNGVGVDKFATVVASTSATRLFLGGLLHPPPVLAQAGVARILATSKRIVCTAMLVDAASASPQGIALHGIRFNPVANTQE